KISPFICSRVQFFKSSFHMNCPPCLSTPDNYHLSTENQPSTLNPHCNKRPQTLCTIYRYSNISSLPSHPNTFLPFHKRYICSNRFHFVSTRYLLHPIFLYIQNLLIVLERNHLSSER